VKQWASAEKVGALFFVGENAMSDDFMAGLARELADALRRYARERHPEDQQEVARLQTSLCTARRAKLAPPAAERAT
jgi:hypothetical protein